MTFPDSELQAVADETESRELLDGGDLDAEPAEGTEIKGRSLGQIAWRRLRRDKFAMAGGIYALFLVFVAVFAKQLTALYGKSYTQAFTSLIDPNTTMPIGPFGAASRTHWLGVTPVGGYDIVSMLIYGTRTSLLIASLATLLSLVFGVTLGLVAGFYRGWADAVIARIMDILLAFPVLLFSIALLAVFSIVPSFPLIPGVYSLGGTPLRFAVIIFVLGFFQFPYIGRIVRGQVLSLREKEFVDSARSLGASNYRIMSREVMPNLIGPILVYATLALPANILGEAGLSYLGVGLQPPTVSLGFMLSDAGNFFQIDPMYLFAPGIAIFLAVLAFNLFGDGLRDALDPKSSR